MRSKTPILLNFLLVFSFSSPTESAVLFVSEEGDGSDGSSWETAFRTPSDALAASSDGDEVWIREGSYHDRGVISTDITLYGGFEGVENETSFGTRDPGSRRTIIDGAGFGEPVLILEDVSDATIDGLTISGGTSLSGGGIRMNNSTLWVNHCILENNEGKHNGGAISVYAHSALHLSNSIIRDNSETSDGGNHCGGGGIWIGSGGYGVFENSHFLRNRSYCSGGAIKTDNDNNVGGSALILGCTFEENQGSRVHAVCGDVDIFSCVFAGNGDPINRQGGPTTAIGATVSGRGISFQESENSIHGCTIQDNHAHGVTHFDRGIENCRITGNLGIGVLESPSISQCEVYGNQREGVLGVAEIRRCIVSDNGNGGIVTTEPTLIENCLIVGNKGSHGGGVLLDPDGSTIRYCTIVDNTAELEGGGVYLRPLQTGFESLSPIILGCIITSNHSDVPSHANIGYWSDGGSIADKVNIPTPTSGPTPFPGMESPGEPLVTFSLIEGGFEGEGNIDADPVFTNSEGGDYSLQYSSPCIDSASTAGPNSDLIGTTRPFDVSGVGSEGGEAFDMGAYEFEDSFPDKNRDGRVDAIDLLMLREAENPDLLIFQTDWYRYIEKK